MSPSSPVPEQAPEQPVKPRKPRMGIDPANIIDGPRLKKRKESPEPGAGGRTKQRKTSEEKKRGTKQEEVDVGTEERVKVAEQGSSVYKAVREEKDATGRSLCYDFLRLPSKRLYPDYYELIKRPLCLEDVKSNLDSLTYSNLEAVRQDLLTIFRNAQRYNMKESQIWQDAKHLKKLINKQFKALNHHSHEDDDDDEEHPPETAQPQSNADVDVMDVDVEGEDGQEANEPEVVGGKTRKRKPPTLQKALRIRLLKLTRQSDEEANRDRCGIFMELPSRKEYPHYYQQIKQPICMNQILDKVNRNEYKSVAECTADVDLMFNNALEFNEEGSDIAEDAKVLKKMWHDSLKSLPTRFSDQPAPNGEVSTKIRIKRPPEPGASSGSPGIVDVGSPGKIASPNPALQSPAISQASPAITAARLADAQIKAMSPVPSPPARAPSVQQPVPVPLPALPRQYSATNPLAAYYSSLYPSAAAGLSPYLSPLPAAQAGLASPAAAALPTISSPASETNATLAPTGTPAPTTTSPAVPVAKSPPPPEDPRTRAIEEIDLVIQPTQRRLALKDDVTKAYSVILGISEKKMLLSLTFNASSLAGTEQDEATPEAPTANGDTNTASLAEKFNCAVKVNGALVKPMIGNDDTLPKGAEQLPSRPIWAVDLVSGMNTVEIGAEPKASHGKTQIWKLFVLKVS